MRIITSLALTVLLSQGYMASAYAGVLIGGTRLIYPEGKKEINITVENKESTPYLIKSFIEKGSIEGSESFFMITPPLFRLDAQQKSVLRIFKASDSMPADRESVFYFNVTSIPSANAEDSKNTLQIAVRNRMKLFFRPKALADDIPENVTNKLTWQRVGNKIKATNPTGYYMNFSVIKINNIEVKEPVLLAPFTSNEYALPEGGVTGSTVEWKIINDQGGIGPEHKYNL